MQTVATAKTDFHLPTCGGHVQVKAGETFCGRLSRYGVFFFWVEAPNKTLYKIGLPDDGDLLTIAKDANTTEE